MPESILKYQYEQIVKQLMLLQDHAAARTCPYTPTGEMCIRKHLLCIEAYVEETLPMEEDRNYQEKLQALEGEALNYRLNQEKVLCRESEQFLDGVGEWARKQRKQFELHCLTCELEKKKEAERKA